MKQQQENHLTAIIGMACRFPGADDYNQFWENLEAGVNSISEIPPQRWEVEKHYSPIPHQPNKTISKWGGLIEGIDRFDAQLFGISSREATRMDPQQRIMLELSWSCIEDAGYSPLELSGSQVGVFIGACNYDYDQLQHQNENIEGHTATGSYTCIIPNRISYFFNFHGPSVPVDTACSSSLVALHQAVNSIKEKECEIALVGGISVLCTPTSYISFSQLGMLSPNGQCKTFDSKADGYVRGEGAGVVLLKPLAKALSDGDRIYGVIKGSAINHGGKVRTLTSPNVYAQAQVLRAAYTKANVAPNTISYIETHGTGTPLGDPIEINGLKRSFKQLHQQYELPLTEKPYCGLGAVKTNIGHLEAAAGIAGVIKVLLAIKHKKMPKIANFQKLNPRIELKYSPFYIVSETEEWQQLQTETGEIIPRRVGVSSFGFGGVNAHVVFEEPPEQIKSQKSKVKSEDVLKRPLHIFKLSGQTEKAVRELAKKYETYLHSNTEVSIQDICFSGNTGRTDLAERLALVAKYKDELQEKLADFIQDNESNGVVRGKAESQENKIAFLFTGQGSQYVDMGRQLYETKPTFNKIIDQCNEILKEYLEIPLLEVIYSQKQKSSSSLLLDQTGYTQPALFAVEYALAKLWQSWGIKPTVVMGHSVGEYVAATVAEVFSLEDGLKLIAARGRLMQQLPPGGEMVAVMASEAKVKKFLTADGGKVAIAAINGPKSVVISGEATAVREIVSSLESEKIKTKQLQVSHAFHSPLMEPMLTEFEAVAKQVTYNQPKIPLISNVTGEEVGAEITTAEYWVGHVRKPVRFAQSMKTLEEQGYETFLEIGPKPILLGMGRQCVTEDVGEWLPSLRPGIEEWQQMLSSLGQLYVKGAKIDWSGFEKDYNRQKVALPTYPFQRERYWIETKNKFWSKQQLSTDQNLHPLLGQKLNCAGEQQIFASQIGEKSPNYLSNHRVFNQALFPTTGYLEIAIAAGNHQLKTPQIVIEDLTISRGWILPAGELTNAQTILTPTDSQSYKFQIFSQLEEEEWKLHTTGKIRKESTPPPQTKIDLEKYKSECNQAIEVKQHYQKCQQVGIDYGNSFQGIQQLWSGSNQALAYIKLPEELITQTSDYNFHPALLDAALQVISHALPPTDSDQTYLPVGIEQFKVYKNPGLSLWAYASVSSPEVESPESLTIVTIVTPSGEIIANLKGLQLKLATKQTLLGKETESIENWLYEVEWRSQGILGRLLPPDFLRPPVEIAQKLAPTLTELVTQVDQERTGSIETSLEELTVDYIVQALQEMGWSYKPTESFEFDAAAKKLGIVPTHRPLFKRLLQILTESGILKSNNQQWQLAQTLAQVNPTQKSQSLQNQYPEEAATLTLLGRCATKLSGVLRGAIDPVQLVFPKEI
ncbi:type I polyketide synthase [Moorena producens JHB]|uniref:Type I polyketide synthase n=1 Tax=Moorena producens (strain JHB) TaxID=1454205 RepID=A0A9Q9SUL1_MOOP1|nr:type I polyketide synthase [Moorena producens]WAN69938.1 type I polyketide synthase [Moorena producens JHB]